MKTKVKWKTVANISHVDTQCTNRTLWTVSTFNGSIKHPYRILDPEFSETILVFKNRLRRTGHRVCTRRVAYYPFFTRTCDLIACRFTCWLSGIVPWLLAHTPCSRSTIKPYNTTPLIITPLSWHNSLIHENIIWVFNY